ncbi:MAG TPA: hypothetical protein VFS23_00230 [Vicinamibacterales bacterium]|nr:hypothetical protein [Vicinamibacterales bacterium]
MMTRSLLLTILLFAAVPPSAGRDEVSAAAQDKTRIDVTGTWSFQVATSAGSGTPTVTFKQAGEMLTGHYSSSNLGEADLTGTVRGRDIAFKFIGTVQGMSVDVAYTGTIESNDAMKGTLDIGGLAQGTFTGKRQ